VIDESIIGGRGQFRDECESLVKHRMETAGFVIYSSSPSMIRKYCNEFYVIDRLGLHQVDTVEQAVGLLGEARLRDGDGYTEEAGEGEVYEINPR
jgi:capsular polysaccharide transport system ATP-binding protein